jgi:parvulin-like peptidyl-prolyl isomerase
MDANIEKKEITPEPVHEKGEKSPKVISVKAAIIVAAAIVLLALAFYCKGVFIAATVNGSPVSRLSIISELEKTSGKKALDAVITKKLLSDEAKGKGITVTSDELNAEISKIETQVKAQGGTLDAVLAQQGMTRKDMEEQITFQKILEKLLGDKIAVTDEEAAKLLADSKISIVKGEEEKYKAQAKEQIRGQKLNDAAEAFIESLKSQASIKYFVNY